MGLFWVSGSTAVNGVEGHSPYFPYSPNEASQSCQPVLQMQLQCHLCASVSPFASYSGGCIFGVL